MRVQYDHVLEKVFESEGTRKYRRLNRRLNVGRTGSLINHRWLQSAVLGQMNHLERESQYYSYNNIHENISQFWLAESSAVLRKYSAIKRNAECFTSVVLRNVFSLWKYWQSEENKLLWTWSNGMVSRAIWKHTHVLVSTSKTSTALVFRTRAILIVFEKLTCACFKSNLCYYLYKYSIHIHRH